MGQQYENLVAQSSLMAAHSLLVVPGCVWHSVGMTSGDGTALVETPMSIVPPALQTC